jgi:predicted  nucleic acid-binding Zn-ribbon protein
MQYVGKTMSSLKKRASALRTSVNNAQSNKKDHLQALKTNQLRNQKMKAQLVSTLPRKIIQFQTCFSLLLKKLKK